MCVFSEVLLSQAAWDRFPPPFSNTGVDSIMILDLCHPFLSLYLAGETGPTSLTVYDCLRGMALKLGSNVVFEPARGLAAAREHSWLEDSF